MTARPLVLATRKSPLALVQAEMAAARLRSAMGLEAELKGLLTTGDQQAGWSLEGEGGKGLFTRELEEALHSGAADLAIHSAKDLPGETMPGLLVAGYLPRADARDVLVMRSGVEKPRTVATGSPRRRLQLQLRFPEAAFVEIRGNVDTRLRKIVSGSADATVLAAAGLARLGIASWEGLRFETLEFTQMVPAVGQGAIALQCRTADGLRFAEHLDYATARSLSIERALQAVLGAGCHTAFGAHVNADTLYLFHEKTGWRTQELSSEDFEEPQDAAKRTLHALGLEGIGQGSHSA